MTTVVALIPAFRRSCATRAVARRFATLALAAVAWGWVAPGYAAESTPDAAKASAKVHYKRAVELIEETAYAEALVEFQRAYELSPHYGVLHNLGMTYVALNRPVEAVDALTRYLEQGAAEVSDERQASVREEIERQRARIGYVVLGIRPQEANVLIDGNPVAPGVASVPLGVGEHTVEVGAPGFQAEKRRISVYSGQHLNLTLDLVALPSAPDPVGQLAVECAIPDAELLVDGKSAGKTPFGEALLLPAGEHALVFQRPGYAKRSATVRVQARASTKQVCGLEILKALPPAESGSLTLAISEPHATLWVDGAKLPLTGQQSSLRLPLGLHQVEVRREGFRPFQGSFSVAPTTTKLDVELAPTAQYRERYESSASNYRTLVYVFGGAAVVVGGVTLAGLVWNNGRFDDWQQDQDRINGDVDSGRLTVEEAQPVVDANNERISDIQTLDQVLVGGGIAAAALGIGAVVLWIVGDDPGRYERFQAGVGPTGMHASWTTPF